MLPYNVNRWINQVCVWGTTHLWVDRRSENGSFNWHIQLFLFWIGSRAWWSRNCLTWWSVDVKPAAVRMGTRSITAAARRQTAAVRWTKNLDRINPLLGNLHWVYGSDHWFIKLLKVRLHCGHLTGTQQICSDSGDSPPAPPHSSGWNCTETFDITNRSSSVFSLLYSVYLLKNHEHQIQTSHHTNVRVTWQTRFSSIKLLLHL